MGVWVDMRASEVRVQVGTRDDAEMGFCVSCLEKLLWQQITVLHGKSMEDYFIEKGVVSAQNSARVTVGAVRKQ